MKNVITLCVILVVGFVSFWFYQSKSLSMPFSRGTKHTAHGISPIIPREDQEEMALVRHIAKSKDKTRIGEVLQRLDHKSEHVRAVSALAIGWMGGHEDKDKLQKLLARSKQKDGTAAKIALARLNVESSGGDTTTQVHSFLSTLGISIKQLNGEAWIDRPDVDHSFGTLALHEIADIVAEANRRGFDNSALEQEIHFTADYPSALKVRLSKMSQNQRIAFLIQNIRTLRPTHDRSYDVQALADEGSAAVPAIIAALKEIHDNIQRDPSWDSKHNGAAGKLMRALTCIGDSRALLILQVYVSQPGTLYDVKPDSFTQADAEFAIRHIKEGRKYCEVVDY